MATYAFQTIFQHSNGLPKDQFVNTTHWRSEAPVAGTDFDNVRDMLKDFYGTAATGAKVCSYLTGDLNTTVKVKAYNLDEEKPRAPAYEGSFTLSGYATGYSMPYEVALCCSFEASRASGKPQGRRRNRFYLGPFGQNVPFTGGRPITTMLDNVIAAMGRLESAQQAAASWQWVVYSPTENEVYDIHHLWVDDAWDTQRRRGLKPAVRKEIFR